MRIFIQDSHFLGIDSHACLRVRENQDGLSWEGPNHRDLKRIMTLLWPESPHFQKKEGHERSSLACIVALSTFSKDLVFGENGLF